MAVFTLVNNQPEFQELWLKYYSQFNFHLLILEHVHIKSEEDLICKKTYEHKKIFHSELFDHNFMNDITEKTQNELLKNYETVIYTDIDELIMPKNCTLEQYCFYNKKPVAQCTGYNLIGEKHIVPCNMFNKPLITRIPVKWSIGWHNCNIQSKPDEDLWLVHIHRMNYEIAKKHWENRKSAKINELSKARKLSWTNYCPLESEFEEWYHSDDHLKEEAPQWLIDNLMWIKEKK